MPLHENVIFFLHFSLHDSITNTIRLCLFELDCILNKKWYLQLAHIRYHVLWREFEMATETEYCCSGLPSATLNRSTLSTAKNTALVAHHRVTKFSSFFLFKGVLIVLNGIRSKGENYSKKNQFNKCNSSKIPQIAQNSSK